ncbi:hypothetical protein EYF80_017932 [Liparis tanakae]|uniref:Uncharacterized protein n=1 Tax=Liparis tanakae TaxID=230148 RepID=A0A4Z2I368_9TELE|nr:hypothetical protein EYF80_017932 [Liparis tanakae]
MGKCGAFMLQNLVTMVKRSRAKGSPLFKGEPEGSKEWKIFSVEKAASHVVTHLSSVLSAREMAGFLTALLQAWLLLQKRYTNNRK